MITEESTPTDEFKKAALKQGRFGFRGQDLTLSIHALERIIERSVCRTAREVIERVAEALLEGYEFKDMGKRRGMTGMPREIVVAHKELCLHIREGVITTVKPNDAYYWAA